MNKEEIIIKTLLEKEPQHIRELARNSKLHPNTVINLVDELKKKGIVNIEKNEKKLIYFSKNLRAKNMKVMYFIDILTESGLFDFLDEFYSYPTVILFGSSSKGELHEESDIDICIITDEKKECDFSEFEDKLKRRIQPFVLNEIEFKKLPKELLNNILNGIVVKGYVEAFK